jgi:hypothetical protein
MSAVNDTDLKTEILKTLEDALKWVDWHNIGSAQ